jgi:hypothetical protein
MKSSIFFCVRKQRRLFAILALLPGLTIMSGITAHRARAQSPLTDGSWSTLSYTMPINPIHCGVTHTGKVVVVAGSENEPGNDEYRAAVWNPGTGTIVVQDLVWDVFCNGMACLPDGRFVIAGGNEQYDPFYGEPRATVFDPATEKFNEVESMAHGRWYATVTALGDGSLMAFSGLDETGVVNKAVEIYKVATGWSPEYIAPWEPPLYPWLHLLPDGDVFYSGSTTDSDLFNPATQTWTLNVAKTVVPLQRTYGSSVLLPLRAATGYLPRVMIMGGGDPNATATAEIIDLSVSTPAWRMIAPMSLPRIQMNAVILPTGKVLALGGSAVNEDPSTASLAADLFDPVTETWASAGVAVYPRLYHSVALLLPDATVWVAGSNPERGTYEEHMEIYSPAYLFTTDGSGNVIPAPRPTITTVPLEIGYGAIFKIGAPNSAAVSSVVLVRPGSSSHAFDMEERLVGLSFKKHGATTLNATAPPNGFVAPPGYYMLFLINQAGVPSLAKFVHLSSTPKDKPPDGTITSPATDLTIQAGESVNFAATARDRDGSLSAYSWVFPGGTPPKSSALSPGLVSFTEAGTYVVSMTALDNLGVNDPSPPTRTIIVQPGP